MSEEARPAAPCKTEQIISAIEWNLYEALLYCRITQKFREAFQNQVLTLSNPFDFGIFRACRNSAVLALNRITDRPKSFGKETTSLKRLLESP
jgi:hypothetical protein